MVWDKQVPFDEHGNLIDDPKKLDEDTVWKDNFEFFGTLNYMGYKTLPGSVRFKVRVKETGMWGIIFPADLDHIMTRHGFPRRGVKDKWSFIKRGNGFGICVSGVKQ